MQVEHTPAVHKRVLDILPGVSGGVARIMVGQPFDTIKTRLQVGAATAHTELHTEAYNAQ
jgi:solute carrier family 25 carnitine/acylcarnitine transporter 20/29